MNKKHYISSRIEKLITDLGGNIDATKNPEIYFNVENLFTYGFENFEIPESHKEYISKHIQVNWSGDVKIMNNEQILQFIRSKGLVRDNILVSDMVFRSLFVLINYNEKELDESKLDEFDNLIDEFYSLNVQN